MTTEFEEEENVMRRGTLVERLAGMPLMNKMYVDSLKYINDTFLSPLRKSVDSPMPMLSLDELTNIASNLETLLNCHSVEERIAKWATNPYVHDLFAEKPSFLEHYNYYVINHYKSLETIDACIEKYPLFAKFLGSLEAEGDVEFKALLSEPLRRVFSYYLIVQEMSQYIKPETEEYEQTEEVVADLKELMEDLAGDLLQM